MTDHTRVPHFPANLEYFAPWVATHGLVAPYGKCQCGCGQDAPIAPRTHSYAGIVKDKPQRYVAGHHSRKVMPVDSRRCTKCQEVKLLSEYTLRASGPSAGKYESQCRACKNAHGQIYRQITPGYTQRARENMRAWRERNREWHQRYKAEYDAKNHDAHREHARKSRKNNPLRGKAHSAVKYAVRRGDFPPASAMVCEYCQEAQAAHWHHHKGYAEEFRLDVVALCVDCHGREHRAQS